MKTAISTVCLLFTSLASAQINIPRAITDVVDESGWAECGVLLSPGCDLDSVLAELGVDPTTQDSGTPELTINRVYRSFNGFSGRINAAGLQSLLTHPCVEALEPSYVLYPQLDESIPQVHVPEVWATSIDGVPLTGTGETIAVIDTGIDTDHAAFAGRIIAQHCFCRVTNDDGYPCCPNNADEDVSAEDDSGHGTFVTGIATSGLPVYTGVAPDANIIALKVCSDGNGCHNHDITAAVDWCVLNAATYDISVLNISIGGGIYSEPCDDLRPVQTAAIDAAAAAGISVAIAAGNWHATDGISAPACISNALAVGGVSWDDEVYWNRSDLIDTVAPSGVYSSWIGGGIAGRSGTSAASPHVAGALILLNQILRLQQSAPLPIQYIRQILADSGDPVYDPGSDLIYSRLNAYRAALMLLESHVSLRPDMPWRYDTAGTHTTTDWTLPAFDDSDWETGAIGFGYGDDDDATPLHDMPGAYSAVFARRQFFVRDPAALDYLVLTVDYDDGFVAYVNGVEVARANVSGTPPAYDTLADAPHEASNGDTNPNPPEQFQLLERRDALVPGVNVLAIQGHNVALDDDDFSLFATLDGGQAHAGDLNCDGLVSLDDIDAFVDALIDHEDYYANQPYCRHELADVNADGTVDFGDINPFVELMLGL